MKMHLWTKFWQDERGFVLSAEAVLVGTVALLGATVGLKMASTAVNEELKDVAFAFRSLDQSYTIRENRACGAWTAGSCYQQQDVETSLAELCAISEQTEGEELQPGDRKYLPPPPRHIPPAPPTPAEDAQSGENTAAEPQPEGADSDGTAGPSI